MLLQWFNCNVLKRQECFLCNNNNKKNTICKIFIIQFRSGRNSAFVQQYEDEKRNTSEWNISHSEYPVQWSLWLPLCFASTITRYANVCTYLMLCVWLCIRKQNMTLYCIQMPSCVCRKKEETAVPVYLAMFSSRRGYFVSLCVSTGIMSFSCSLRQCRLLSASCNANTSILILHLLYFPSGMAR